MGGDAPFAGELGQPLAVGAVLAAEHDHDIGAVGEHADRLLAVLGRVADVVLRGANNVGKPSFQADDDPRSVVDREGRLRQIGETILRAEGERVDILRRIDEREGLRRLPHRADHLVMPLVADEHDLVAALGVLDRLEVDLRHQWAGGIDRQEAALGGNPPDLRGDTVGGKQEHRPFRDVLDPVDEYGPLALEPLDDMLVVDDFVVDVNRGAMNPDRRLERLDRHVDAGTETAGAGKEDVHRAFQAEIGGSGGDQKEKPIS